MTTIKKFLKENKYEIILVLFFIAIVSYVLFFFDDNIKEKNKITERYEIFSPTRYIGEESNTVVIFDTVTKKAYNIKIYENNTIQVEIDSKINK